MNTSIKWKIITFFILIQILILTGIGLYLSSQLKSFFYQEMEANMVKQLNLLSELLEEDLLNPDYSYLQEYSLLLAQDLEGRITVIAADGKVLSDTEENPEIMENHANRPEIQEAKLNGFGWSTRYSSTLNIDMKYLAKKIESAGYVRIAIPVREVQETLFKVLSRLAFGLILVFVLFFFLVLKVSASITEPVKRITQTAYKIANGNLSERIHIYTKDEIGTLSRMFNLMAYQLEETITSISTEKEKLATILVNMADGLIALDREKRIILINPAAVEIFGVDEAELKGKTMIELNRNQRLTEVVQEVYQTGLKVSTEIQLHFPKEVILRTQVAPITRQTEEILGLVLIFTDITELRRLEHLRTDFVGNVSHELKTPLTSIRGYIETLQDMDMTDVSLVKRFLGVVNRESERLARLINDLLDLSKLEGKRHHQLLPTHLEDVLANVVDILKPEADKKAIELQIEIEKDLPKIMGIEEQLNQVMINLIDNAIKYTPRGGQVKVTLNWEANWVILVVSDNGIGIPKEDLERIFERFYRVDKARTRQMGGTGLGLSIVRHIIKAHTGEIDVVSEVGLGTTFTVKFPREDQN